MTTWHRWTNDEDSFIIRARQRRVTLAAIADRLGMPLSVLRRRVEQLEARGAPRERNQAELAMGWRMPLPAGHPISWGAITQGTLLEGVRFEPEQ